jgi:hypothetical protein
MIVVVVVYALDRLFYWFPFFFPCVV